MNLSLSDRYGKQICPYCFEPFRLRDTPFRCSSPGSVCSPVVDSVRKKVWDDAVPVGKVLKADGTLARARTCSDCGQASKQRICPACHMDLPYTVGRYRSLIFAVIGARQAGKTHYVAVLIDRLRKELGPRLGMLLEELDDETVKRYREQFHRPLFHHRQAIPATVSALAERRNALPLVYSLTFRAGRRIRSVVNLVFFDTAGEDLKNEDVMATVNKYIYRSDGLILLLDPLQLDEVRGRLGGSIDLPDDRDKTENFDVLNRVTRLIRKGRDLEPKKQIEAPIAVAFSKFDAVEPLVYSDMQLLHDARHEGGFDRRDFEAVHDEMISLLADWDSRQIVNQVETNYRRFGFFGLSALGMNPGKIQKVPNVLPRRVADPFLWLLYRHGLIADRDGKWATPVWRRAWESPPVRWAAGIVLILLALGAGIVGITESWDRVGALPGSAPIPTAPADARGGTVPPPAVVRPAPVVPVTVPVRLTNGIRFRNETAEGVPLGGFANRFRKRDLRYVAFHLTVEPVVDTARGRLQVLYFDKENRVLVGSETPADVTVARSLEIFEATELSNGYGAPEKSIFDEGRYAVEVRWDEHELGRAEFEVVEG